MPATRVEAELWALAAELRLRPIRVLTGTLWELGRCDLQTCRARPPVRVASGPPGRGMVWSRRWSRAC